MLSASTVIAYVAVGAAAILSRSVEEAARDVLAWVLPRNGKAPQSNGSLSCPLLGKQRTHMFSFLKRRRSPKQRIERTVRFVGERDGPIERRLKADLLTVLNARPNIKSPYLARVAYDNPKAQEVVLALRSVSGHDTDLVSFPRFRGHPNSHESAVRGCHGKAEAEDEAIVLA